MDAPDDVDRDAPAAEVGVGPHPLPWPDDDRLDPDLLRDGDRRNVVDRYRYWTVEAIVADLDRSRHPFHVAIENLAHDFNIGSVVRTANAFNAASVRVVGRRRWNRRGRDGDRPLPARGAPRRRGGARRVGARPRGSWSSASTTCPGAVPLETFDLPRECVLLFGQEGTGLSDAARAACAATVSIAQYGSTRSINVGAAAAIAMHAWVRAHADIGRLSS